MDAIPDGSVMHSFSMGRVLPSIGGVGGGGGGSGSGSSSDGDGGEDDGGYGGSNGLARRHSLASSGLFDVAAQMNSIRKMGGQWEATLATSRDKRGTLHIRPPNKLTTSVVSQQKTLHQPSWRKDEEDAAAAAVAAEAAAAWYGALGREKEVVGGVLFGTV
jgi:hypothetical protein